MKPSDTAGNYSFNNQFGSFNTVQILELSQGQFTVNIKVRNGNKVSCRSTYFEGNDIIPFYEDLIKRSNKTA